MNELEASYRRLVVLVQSLSEEDAWAPTGCRGMAVRDLVMHLLEDARRALVAFATPTDREPDRDAVTYWRDSPGPDDPQYRDLRALRTIAAAYGLTALKSHHAGTAEAVVRVASATDPTMIIETQGHALTVGDLTRTLVFEAAVHHLDLVAHLEAEGPPPSSLVVVRETLDGLLNRPRPDWDDATYALKATGRRDLTQAEADMLGVPAGRLSLIS